MMTLEEHIAQVVAATQRPLLEKIEQLLTATAPVAELLTVDQAADLTQYSRKTVLKWITEGKLNAYQQRIYLPAAQFAVGEWRIRRTELEAFGAGQGTPRPVAGRPRSARTAPAAQPASSSPARPSPAPVRAAKSAAPRPTPKAPASAATRLHAGPLGGL